MRKQFSNQEILTYTQQLNKEFIQNGQDIQLPIRLNFYLQKNYKTFMDAAQDIEKLRLQIGEKYGTLENNGTSYSIKDPDKLKQAKHDLDNLLSIDQVLDIYIISLNELEQITSLSVSQMNAILFMIDDSEPKIQIIDDEDDSSEVLV